MQYELSGAQIVLIVKNTAYKVASQNTPVFDTQDFEDSIKEELNNAFGEVKKLGFE